MSGDRGTLVSLRDDDTWTFLNDAFGWVRDIAAKGIRSVADTTDDWASELDKLSFAATNTLQDYLKEQDSWIANLFAELLSIVEMLNPLTIGKEIAMWILEDFRDILRALAMLIDTEEDTAEETQAALVDLGIAAAALCIPYIGRAGKVIYRMLPNFANVRLFTAALDTKPGAAMLRYISSGDVISYLKRIDFPSYTNEIRLFLQQVLQTFSTHLSRFAPGITSTITRWSARIAHSLMTIMRTIQQWLSAAIAQMQRVIFYAASNATNPRVLDKIPDQVLDWVHSQINGNMAESCVDNYFMNYMGYDRLYPINPKRDTSVFFGPDQGIDGFYETTNSSPTGTFRVLPEHYNGIPKSLGWVLDELEIEIPGESIAKAAITQQIKPFGNIRAEFKSLPAKPRTLPRFVIMEAKFGYHAKRQEYLTDAEWRGKLGNTADGSQMSKTWIDSRLQRDILLALSNQKRRELGAIGYKRWLYGCQPVNAENSKRAQARGGKRLQGLAFFPPYALKGFDLDKLR